MTGNHAFLQLQAQIHRETRNREGPAGRLMPWLLDRRNLAAAWERVSSTEGANTPGLDGLTCAEVQNRSDSWLARLADDLCHGRYLPRPPRWIDVPKHPGSTRMRRLGILTIQDRLVHAAIKQILEPVLEPGFHRNSFGFRPGRSVPGALAEAARLLAAETPAALPFHYAVHLDIADCFPTVDHRLLLQELAGKVADPSLLTLIERLLLAGGTTVRHWWQQRTVGLIQGSALSPLLCNLYLHPLDACLDDLGRGNQNGIQFLRYADDLLLLAHNARLGRQAVRAAGKVLAQLRQAFRDPSAELRPMEEGVAWLGVRIQRRPNPWTGKVRFGYLIPDNKVRDMLARLDEMTVPPSTRIEPGAFNLGRWVVSVNDQLRDWDQAYLYADNAAEVFRTIDDHAHERVAALLHTVTGTRFRDLFGQYRVWLPRGFWTWEVDGTRMVVLSSLAPRCPRHLTRRPPWLGLRFPSERAVKAAGNSPSWPNPPAAGMETSVRVEPSSPGQPPSLPPESNPS